MTALRLMWAVTRDDEIFAVKVTRREARLYAKHFLPGSKDRWSVCRVRVTPIKTKERRR